MPEINVTIRKWWKKVLLFVLLCGAIASVIVFLKPREYLSVATAVPASSFSSDKSSIFNENIQELYSSLGEADDLDRVLGTAALDTIYLDLVTELGLDKHYKIDKGSETLYRAAQRLKKNVKVSKSGYGELKVKAWDVDKDMAAAIANGVINKLNRIHSDLNNLSNTVALNGLIAARNKLRDTSGAGGKIIGVENGATGDYEKLIARYQLLVDTKPPALIVTEHAKPALYANRPRRKLIIASSMVLSLIFSVLVISFFERSKTVGA